MEIVIYIPTKDELKLYDIVEAFLKVSGLTVIKNCFGLWLDKGITYKDDITLIQILLEDKDELLTEKLNRIKALIILIRKDLKQDCILYTLNHNPIFI